jgi:RNA polymerase sigma-70 factor, ECF subfamily
MGETSTGLLVRIKSRDQEGWREFVQLYGPLVYSWCRRAGLQEADAADVGQNVFRTVAGSIDGYHHEQDGDSFRGWLRTVTRTRIIDFQRRQAREPRGAGGSEAQAVWLELPASSEDLGSSDVEEKSILIRRAVDMVLGRCETTSRQAFLRVVIAGEHPEGVARDLGVTVNAIYLAKSHILRRIREALAGVVDL